jgi:DNA-binding transcriptional LysR family regulator
VTLGGRLRLSSAEGVRAAVLSAQGLAIASEWMFAPELAAGAARTVLSEWQLPPVDLWALFPGGRLASPAARALAAHVARGLRRGGPAGADAAP